MVALHLMHLKNTCDFLILGLFLDSRCLTIQSFEDFVLQKGQTIHVDTSSISFEIDMIVMF